MPKVNALKWFGCGQSAGVSPESRPRSPTRTGRPGWGLRLDAVSIRAPRNPAGADALIAQVQDEVRSCVGEIRKIIEGLRPPVLDERGLLGALQQHADLIADRAPLRITVEGADLPPLPAAVEVVAYLIGQEALTNAVRHAAARHIAVTVAAHDSDLVLDVRDDGTGLPEQRRRGVGLLSMAERAGEIGGELVVTGEAPGGTRVRARLPLLPPEPADGDLPVAVVEGRR
jgi:signal transduction histidine kinase